MKKNLAILGVACIAAIAATAFYITKKNASGKKEKPPAKAPQLDIKNPGDQSDFPAAATDDKNLG